MVIVIIMIVIMIMVIVILTIYCSENDTAMMTTLISMATKIRRKNRK